MFPVLEADRHVVQRGGHVLARMGFVRSGFVQIGGALVVGVAGRTHAHTHMLDSSATLERVNPHKGYVFAAQREATTVVCVG